MGSRVCLRRARYALATGTLAGALLLCTSAFAQDESSEIEKRIENTFDLVIGNTADLAIPLTRRALARRSEEDKAIEPLSYRDATSMPDPDFAPVSIKPAPMEAVFEAGAADDVEVARLPRPRPARVDDPPDKANAPLDLVAGAPAAPTPEELAAAEAAAKPAPLASDQPILPAAHAEPTPELVASGACLSPSDVADKDGDFKRNAEALSGNAFCIAEETFKERRRTWTVQTVKTSRPGPLWAVMHDDEDMSFDTAVEALKAYGGTLVTVDTGGRRNQDGIDPNRNFSADGIGCSKLGTDAAPLYTAFFRNLMSEEPIIALHNNVDGPVSTGGIGHASMERVPKDMEATRAPDQKGPLAGERNLVLLVSAIPVSTTSKTRAAALAAKGINAMIEGVRDGKGDCSLSNYALLTDHPDYLNVTVDHGERDKQVKIIDVIMAGRNDAVATQ